MPLLPDLADVPMTLGDHLHELRRRLIVPVIVLTFGFFIGFTYDHELKLLLVRPLQRAIEIVGPEGAAKVGLPIDGNPRMLQSMDLSESAIMSVRVSTLFAIAVSIPVFVYQFWRFIVVGLKRTERQLGFLFIPAGVALFYLGAVSGYFYGLPYLYAWLIQWAVDDPTIGGFTLSVTDYHANFVAFTLCFGAVMDIPWLVVVLCRVGLVTPEWVAKRRRVVIVINLLAAAAITPTSDPYTLMLVFVPMQLLFEIGIISARLVLGRGPRRALVGGDEPTDRDGDR